MSKPIVTTMHPLITSNQNPKIKNVLVLEKARERNQQNVFIVEGIKELSLALEGKYVVNTVFFCPQIIPHEAILKIVSDENLLIPVQQSVFEKIAYRNSTGGILAIMQQRRHTLEDIKLRENPLVLVLESVEKPGNLGAALRTADAADIDAVGGFPDAAMLEPDLIDWFPAEVELERHWP